MELQSSDALIIVDVQNDFLPGGSLAVPEGGEVVPVLNEYLQYFKRAGCCIYATRDWHPENHCSFREQGGPWPPHCIANTSGAAFCSTLQLPADAIIISKATTADRDAYSGFEGTDLAERCRATGCRDLFIGGLATDYCVLNTVLDALREGFRVHVLRDAIRAVNVEDGDGEQAIEQMEENGADFLSLEDIRVQ